MKRKHKYLQNRFTDYIATSDLSSRLNSGRSVRIAITGMPEVNDRGVSSDLLSGSGDSLLQLT